MWMVIERLQSTNQRFRKSENKSHSIPGLEI